MFQCCIRTEFVPLPKNMCRLPIDGGNCRAYIPKFGFNSETGRCESFSYGGCHGNGNRFVSFEECFSLCGGKPRKIGIKKDFVNFYFIFHLIIL
ncbi:Boophilin-H2 [Armadillidium vulgare]|nr:Boophilin-H2 [Armadillidium vulgare]